MSSSKILRVGHGDNTPMLYNTIDRLSSQRAACKQWGVFLAVAILLTGALGGLSAVSLLWAAAPLCLLGLADAGYKAQQERFTDAVKGNIGEQLSLLPPEPAGTNILRTVSAAISLSIWPFYLGLFGIVAAGAFSLPRKDTTSFAAIATSPAQVYPQTNAGPMLSPSAPAQLANRSGFSLQAVPNSVTRQTTPPIFQRTITPVNYAARPIVRPPANLPLGTTPSTAPSSIPARQNP